MKRFQSSAIALILFVCVGVLGACSTTKESFILLPNDDGSVGEVTVRTEGGEQVLNESYQSTSVSKAGREPSAPVKVTEESVRAVFSESLEAQPLPSVRFILYFQKGSTAFTEESEAHLPDIREAVVTRPMSEVSVTGHSDRVGSEEVNMALSLKRARSVAEILVSIGVPAGQIAVTSHGEGNLLVPTADEVPEPRNRRVEVLVR